MFENIKRTYNTMREYYHSYSYNPTSNTKTNKFSSFFKAIFSYIFRRPKPFILSGEQRSRFEKGLGSLANSYRIEYRPGSIIFRPKGLERRV